MNFIVANEIQTTITDVRSFSVTFKFSKLQEGYLGETTDRYDEIFTGAEGKVELHIENDDIFAFVQKILDRARRRDPSVRVNAKATFNFPNGDRPRIALNDLFFGDVPINFGSRTDYGTVGLDFSCSNIKAIS